MANVNQIYGLVNDAAKEALGTQAIAVKDTATLVSLGDVVLSTKDNKENFYKALCDRIGRTVIAVRELESKTRAVKKDDLEWGIALQKISYKIREAVANPTWVADTQADPFDVEIQTEAVQTIFSKMSTYSYEDSLPDGQLFTAFVNAAAMAAFVAGIYTNQKNYMEIAERNLANLAVSTNIAGVLIKGKEAQKRNLLAEYNDISGEAALSVEQALKDLGFLKYASREISIVRKNMTEPGMFYNITNDIMRHTPEDKMVLEVNAQFASACDSYLQADTYHNELVKLPMYEEVNYWQAPGTAFAFEDVSKVNIQNVELATESNLTGAIEQGGIIAFLHDYDSCGSIITRRRSNSIYNPRAERYNIFEKADKGYMVDLTENAVVFFLGE